MPSPSLPGNAGIIDENVRSILPEELARQEQWRDGLDMQKLLLERMLLRKDMRLKSFKEKLDHQSEKLSIAEERIRYYESLAGWRTAQLLSNLYLLAVQQARKIQNLPVLLLKVFSFVLTIRGHNLVGWVFCPSVE